jgi:hypothetical protein
MSREQRQQRNVKYLLWVLAVLNMLGLYLLQHPDVLNAGTRPSTSFADARPLPAPPVPRAA